MQSEFLVAEILFCLTINCEMSTPPRTPGPLYKPFEKLVKIHVLGKDFEVPEGNILLRAFQYMAPETVPYGRFCWNEECQYCRVHFDVGPDSPERVALSCKLVVKDGMRVTEAAQEIRYCLRTLKLDPPKAKAEGGGTGS
ncbi:MAG: ferredoxin [Acidobacteriales bacterium]|nr:ferredoxin [Terriglobales bacterium]